MTERNNTHRPERSVCLCVSLCVWGWKPGKNKTNSVCVVAAVTHFGGESLSLVAAAERETHSRTQAPEIIQPQEPVWPASLGRATQASLPLAAPPRRSAATSDVATSGMYLKHKEKVCPGMSALHYHTHTKKHSQPFKDSPRMVQRSVRGRRTDHSVQITPSRTGRHCRAHFQRASVIITRRPGTPPQQQPGLKTCSSLAAARQRRLAWEPALLSARMAAGFSQHRLEPGSQRGSEVVARRAARSWRASGSPLAMPLCQPGCCRRACWLVCDWTFWKEAESHLRLVNVPQWYYGEVTAQTHTLCKKAASDPVI